VVVMAGIDWKKHYPDPCDAECCEGYYDGFRKDTPEPNSNRHPAYIHGFRNGREDAGITPRIETSEQRRRLWDLIVASCSDGPPSA
jgi:hypothetical protein